MIFKNYQIVIEPRNGFVMPTNIPTILGCSVSEPSAFAATSRGLTFTDKDKIALDDHPVFTHRHTFVKQLPGSPPEQAEIDHLVWSLLTAINIGPTEVNVRVSYLDTVSG